MYVSFTFFLCFFSTLYIYVSFTFCLYLFRTKQCHFECSLHLKKEIDLCKLPRQHNLVERFNKKFVENTFHFSEIDYPDHCTSQIFYNYSNILLIRHVVDNI